MDMYNSTRSWINRNYVMRLIQKRLMIVYKHYFLGISIHLETLS